MKNKKNILDYLFICIIINMIPIFLLGVFSISNNLYTMLVAIAYVIQTIMMFFIIREKFNNITRKELTVIILFLLLQLLAQLINYLNFGVIISNDIFNIVSTTLNILIFMILVPKFNITNNELLGFMKKIVLVGLIAGIYNFFVNGAQILRIGNFSSSYSLNFSSFFPNRNQFGIFMLVAIISNLYIIKDKDDKKYKLAQLFFVANLLLTMSRTSILGLLCVYALSIYYNSKENKINKKKLLILFFSLIIFGIFMIVICNDSYYSTIINRLFIRSDTLETGSGRFVLWCNGIKIALKNDILLGIGRFRALEINRVLYNSPLEYFHSIYVETFVTYGIFGIILLIKVVKYILSNVKNNFNKYQNIMRVSIISFMIVSIFETTTRFSIGYADTMSMIYFFTIPLLFINSNK